MANLASLVISLEANIAKFQTDLGKAAAEAQKRAQEMDKAFGIVSNSLKALGAAAAIGLTFDSIKSKIEGVISSAAGLQQLSERTGATVEGLSALAATAKLSGTDNEALATGLQKLAKSMVDAQNGGAKTSEAFRAIGIATKDLVGLKPDEAFLKISLQLAKYQDGAEKVAIAQTLLGKSGANLLPVAKDLADIGELQTKVTAEQAAQADEYEKNTIRLNTAQNALFKTIGLELVPVLNAFTKALLDSVTANDGLRAGVKGLAADGSIRDWAEGAAKAAAFVVDAFDGVVRVVQIVGKTLGALAASAVAVVKGNFAEAKNIGEQADADVQSILQRATFSARLATQLANGNKTGEAAAPRKTINFNPNASSGQDVAKAQFQQQIKALNDFIKAEEDAYKLRDQVLGNLYQDDLLSISGYFAAKKLSLQGEVQDIVAAYDKEIDAANKYIASAKDQKTQIEATTARNDIVEKRQRAVNDAVLKGLEIDRDATKAKQAYSDQVASLSIKLLELQGRYADAAEAQNKLSFRQISARAAIEGDTGTAAIVAELERQAVVRGQLNDLTEKSQLIEDNLATAEGRINLARTLGNQTDLQGMVAVGTKRQEAAAQLEKIAADYERIAAASGDPRLVANAAAFKLKVDELAASANELAKTFNDAFASSFENAFADFVTGTKTAKEAFQSFAKDVISQIAHIAAKNLAQSLFGGSGAGGSGGSLAGIGTFLASLFGGGRATGGYVSGNTAYRVGEQGPELFVPQSSGTIVPAQRGGVGGAITVNVTMPPGADRRTALQFGQTIAGQLQTAVARNA